MSRVTAWSLVCEARSRVESLAPLDVLAALDGETLLVDVREEQERVEHGFIPGAVFAPRGMLEFWGDPESDCHRREFDPERRIILHCAFGGRSALAADTLRQMGYGRVAHLGGGLHAWKEDGREMDFPGTGSSEKERGRE